MKQLRFCIVLLLLSTTLGWSQTPAKLIVRGDDMGFSHAGNLGLIESYVKGIETSIEVIVPSPWFPEAVEMLKEHPNVDVGIHLALTSEWDNIKYRPLTNCPSITNEDGYFHPFIWSNPTYPNKAIKDFEWKLEDVEKEFRAQIEMAKKYIPNISHASGHMGCTGFDPTVKEMTKRLLAEYGIELNPSELGVKSVSYVGEDISPTNKKKGFIKMLETLEAGQTYLFVDHPAIASSELRAIGHKGYENVSADRQDVVDIWTSNSVRKSIHKNNIELISYADLKTGHELLFNGKDHSGWYIDVPEWDKNPETENPFIVRDGKMVSLAHTGGHIITEKEYENYRLDLDYRFAGKPGNCGILVQVSKPRRLYGMFPQSIEVQLMHENAGDFWCIGENIAVENMESRRGPKEKWGVDGDKARRIKNLTDNSEKPVGEWNHARIECLGDQIKVWINGQMVNHGFGNTAIKGKIALQAEGSEVEFRNVELMKITELAE